jgi:hypothetical protein
MTGCTLADIPCLMVVARPTTAYPTISQLPALSQSAASHPTSYTTLIMAAGGAKQSQGKMLGSSHAEVFNMMDLKERDQVVKVVKQEDVSLGMVDPSTGRYAI